MERAPLRNLRWHGDVVVVLFLLTSLGFSASCHRTDTSFASLLEKIDSSPQDASTDLYMQAVSLASGTEDQIRLLKRASIRTPDSFADIASAIAKTGSVTEPVALALLDAFLSANRCMESLGLFQGPLDAAVWPSQFVETYILSLRNNLVPAITIEQLVACADVTTEYQFLVYAAVQAMKNGDKATARTLLIDSQRFVEGGQSSASYMLLWDAGAIESLSNSTPDPADPQEIAVCADADYLRGDIASACTSWAYLIDRFPTWSWKPYAALARALYTETDPVIQDWPHAPFSDSWTVLSSPLAMEERLYSKTQELFSDSAEASFERARWLHSRNRIDEALTEVTGLTGEAAGIAMLEYGFPERAVPDALRLVAGYQLSPLVNDAALEALARAGAWEQFRDLAEKCQSNGLQTRRGWFWEALLLVLRDDATNAAEVIRNYGPEQSGFAGAFNLGILELAVNRPNYANESFMIAVGLAHDPREKAIAYVRAGDALLESRLPEKAALAYEAALGSDPASREARSRLMRLKVNN